MGSAYPSLKAFAYEKLALSGNRTRSAHHQQDLEGVEGETALELPTTILSPGVSTEIALPGPAHRSRGYTGLTFCCSDQAGRMSTTPSPLACSEPRKHRPGRAASCSPARPTRARGMCPISRAIARSTSSNAGYGGGGAALPNVQARVAVEPGEGDDSARIQAAIDQVSAMPQNADWHSWRRPAQARQVRGWNDARYPRERRSSTRRRDVAKTGTIRSPPAQPSGTCWKSADRAGRLLLPARTPIAGSVCPLRRAQAAR